MFSGTINHKKRYEYIRKGSICCNVQQSTTMYDNLRKYTNIYEMMFIYVRQYTTKTHHYDINVVAQKSFTCKTFFFDHGFSYENLRITANKRDMLRKAANFQFAPCLTLNAVSGTAPLCCSPTYEF